MPEQTGIVRKLTDEDMHITPQALDMLRGMGDYRATIEKLLQSFKKMPEKPSVITEEIIREILGGGAGLEGESASPGTTTQPASKIQEASGSKISVPEQKSAMGMELRPTPGRFKPLAAEVEPRIEVLQDVTGHSNTEGELEDFVRLFNDRYKRLSKILKKRVDLRETVPIGNVSSYEDRSVKIIGIVSDKRETRKKDLVMELEDPSGRVAVFIHKSRRELMRKAAEVVTDEVIGVQAKVGKRRAGRRTPLLFPNNIIWPDVPVSQLEKPRERGSEGSEEPLCAALVSDLHVGSEMFLEDAFMKFIKWLRGEAGGRKQRELASRVKYLVIAGDLVDGIGVYPRQEEELLISDIYKQYDAVAELLSQVPDYVKIVIAPGNHDAVRLPEPQPALGNGVAPALSDLGPLMVSNPAWLLIHGTKFLVYHGRSYDDLISADSDLNREDSIAPMVKLLRKRHLAPIYGEPMGGRTPLAPEERDYLVIEDVPDVFHCGHLHVYGCGKYRGVVLVNSATFQERTIYMKRMGAKPTPGIVPIVNLQTNHVRAIRFA
jgi:DNA polymerase II small subunit